MPYTPPHTWVNGEIPGETVMNQEVRDNTIFALNGKQIVQKRYTGAANYTLTGAGGTSWADVDGTNLSLAVASSFITQRLRCKAVFWAAINYTDAGATPPYKGYFDLMVDGATFLSTLTGTSNYGSAMVSTGAGAPVPIATINIPQLITIEGLFTGLTANAVHTVKLRWKIDHAQAQLIVYNNTEPPVFMMIEEP